MEKITRILLQDQLLFKVFLNLKDPRVGDRCLYPLINILFITVCALISGCDGWKAIENFGRGRTQWLSRFIHLENRIPCHLTIVRAIARIDPKALEYCVRQWFQRIYQLGKILQKNKEDEASTRYYITSLPFKIHDKMCEAIQAH